MKKLTTLIAVMFLLAMPLALAEEEIATQEDIQEAGMTPDNPFYTFDLLFERVSEFFSEKAKLLHAKERVAEVKVMIYENKIEHAEKARIKFKELRLRIKDKVKIEEHTKLINSLGQKISEIASVKGKLSIEKRQEIKELIIEHKENITLEAENILIEVFPYFGKNCANVAQEHLQRCCHVWAVDNNIPKPKCEGKWVIDDGKCAWKCGINSEGTSLTAIG